MKITDTRFPNDIDARVYAQDITLNDLETFSEYQTLIAQGKYKKASDWLNKSDAYFYGAWMLNLLEKRLKAIKEYVFKLEDEVLTYAGESEPDDVAYGTNWISDDWNNN